EAFATRWQVLGRDLLHRRRSTATDTAAPSEAPEDEESSAGSGSSGVGTMSVGGGEGEGEAAEPVATTVADPVVEAAEQVDDRGQAEMPRASIGAGELWTERMAFDHAGRLVTRVQGDRTLTYTWYAD